MPKDSKVGRMYDAMVEDGMPKSKAARIAQAKSGQALSTGKPARTKGGKPAKRKKKSS